MSDQKPMCMSCRFWKSESESSNWGECRRYPPKLFFDGNSSSVSLVKTNGGEWCGEFDPIEKERWIVKHDPVNDQIMVKLLNSKPTTGIYFESN